MLIVNKRKCKKKKVFKKYYYVLFNVWYNLGIYEIFTIFFGSK